MRLVKLCSAQDIPEGSMRRFEINGENILVAQHQGKFYAMGERCSHRGGPLSEGTIEQGIITCPWHFGQFDLITGKVVSPPPSDNLATLEARVDEGNLYLSVP